MANKITTILDLDGRGFDKSIKSIRREIAETDGTLNKFKVGAKGAFDGMKQYGTEAAFAAGAALVAFSAKSVAAFSDLALESGRLSDALGIPVEEMSRLVEVAGDLGIESSSLEAALGKMNNTAGKSPAAFEAIGAEIVKTQDGATDVNATFLSTVDALNRIQDPAKRAAAAQQIFGRSWRDSAELIGLSSKQITDAMNAVSDAQVIDEDEVQKARDYREAMDALNDTIQRLMLNVGEALVPVITKAVETTEDAEGAFHDLDEALGPVDEALTRLAVTNWKYLNPAGQAITALGLWGDRAEDTTGSIGDLTTATDKASTALSYQPGIMSDTEIAAGRLAAEIDEVTDSFEDLKDEIADENAYLDAADGFDKVRDAALDAYTKAAEGSSEAEQAARDYQRAINDQQLEILELIEQLGNVPPETTAKILAELDQGNVDEAERILNQVARTRNSELLVFPKLAGALPSNIPFSVKAPGRASGGPVTAGGTYLVGEQGPELLQMGNSSGNVVNASKTAAALGSGGGTTVYLTVNSLDARTAGKHIKQALDEYYKSGGAR